MPANEFEPTSADDLGLESVTTVAQLGAALTALLHRDARARNAPKWTLRELNEALGYSVGSLSSYLGGTGLPKDHVRLDELVIHLQATPAEQRGFAEAWERVKTTQATQKPRPRRREAGPQPDPSTRGVWWRSWLSPRRRWLAAIGGVVLVGAVAAYASAQMGQVNPHCTETCVFHGRDTTVPVQAGSAQSSPVLARVPNRASVRLLCWIDDDLVDEPAGNYKSQRWFRITVSSGPKVIEGYVHSSMVFEQRLQPNRPHC